MSLSTTLENEVKQYFQLFWDVSSSRSLESIKSLSDLPRNCTTYCSFTVARDINDLGTVVLNYDSRVGLVQQSDGTTTQAPLYRTLLSIAINNQDQVISTGIYSGGFIRGRVSGNGKSGTLIATSTEASDPYFPVAASQAEDIDDSGNIVGASRPSSLGYKATLWEDITKPGVILGTLGGNTSNALGINNSQQIVGVSSLANSSTPHAFLWEGGELIDLNSLVDPGLGWELTSAFEINNNGDIIGIGNFNGAQQGFIAKAVPEPTSVGEQRGFIATAVPEPTSVLGVLGLGLFGLGGLLKRKK